MYRKLHEPRTKKQTPKKLIKSTESKKQKQINMIKNTKMNPILKLIYLSNYR